MIIIAILAAIAIPVFFQQRDKGLVAQIQSALANGRIAAESFRTDAGDGDFAHSGGADMDMSDLFDEGLRAADVVVLDVVVSGDNQDYCIQSIHPGLVGHEWHVATQETDGEPSPADDCFL